MNLALLRCLSTLEGGSPTWARTRDLRINSPALYRLSYRGAAKPLSIATFFETSKLCFDRCVEGTRLEREEIRVAVLVGRLAPGAAVEQVVDAGAPHQRAGAQRLRVAGAEVVARPAGDAGRVVREDLARPL